MGEDDGDDMISDDDCDDESEDDAYSYDSYVSDSDSREDLKTEEFFDKGDEVSEKIDSEVTTEADYVNVKVSVDINSREWKLEKEKADMEKKSVSKDNRIRELEKIIVDGRIKESDMKINYEKRAALEQYKYAEEVEIKERKISESKAELDKISKQEFEYDMRTALLKKKSDQEILMAHIGKRKLEDENAELMKELVR